MASSTLATWRRPLAGALLAGALAGPAAGGPRSPDPAGPPGAATEIVQMRLEGALEEGMLAYLHRVLEEARSRGARLVVELDTPGGETGLMWRLATALSDARKGGVRTTAFVNDQAMSAGALIAMSCEGLYMRPHATIGAALPVQIGPGGLMPAADDPDVREKINSSMRSEFHAIAAETGRPTALAEAMVDPGQRVFRVRERGEIKLLDGKQWDDALARGDPVELIETVVAAGELFACTGTEAVSYGLADGLVDSLEDLADKLGGGTVVRIERRPSEELAGLLYRIWPLLLLLGIVFAYVEFKVPGFGIPGVLSIACFGVLLFGRYLVGLADVPHIVLVVVGIVLVAVELFVVPGTVWVGLLGGLLALGGLVWSLTGGVRAFDSDLGRTLLLDDAMRVVGAAGLAALCMWGLSRLLPRTPLYRRLALVGGPSASAAAKPDAGGPHAVQARVGAQGRALTALRPGGKVVLDAAPRLHYEARSDGPELRAGSRVRVVEVLRSGRLVVAEAQEDGGAD